MRRAIALTLWCVIVLSSAAALSQSNPEIDEPVEDLADVVNADVEAEIEDRLRQHYAQTGVQMAVLLVETTDGEPIEDFSLRVAQEWEGGRSGEDRGVLLTLAIEDRRSRFEVGYGLEPILTDGYAAVVLEEIRPELQAEEYGAAVDTAVDMVFARTGHLRAGEAIGLMDSLTLDKVFFWYWVFFFAGALILGALAWVLFKREKVPSTGLAVAIGTLTAVVSLAAVFWITSDVAPVGYSLTFGVGAVIGVLSVMPRANVWVGFTFWTGIGLFLTMCFGDLMRPEFPETTNGALIFAALFVHGGVCMVLFAWGLMARSSRSYTIGPDGERVYERRTSSYSSSSSSGSFGGGGGSFGGGGASGSW